MPKYHTRESIAVDVIVYGAAAVDGQGERVLPIDKSLCRPEAYRITEERIAGLLTDDPLQLFRETGCLENTKAQT